MSKVIVDKALLGSVVGYIDTLLDFIDVDDLEDEEDRDNVRNGYKDFIEPLVKLAFDDVGDANVVDEGIIARRVDIQVFKEHLEDLYHIKVSELSDEQIEKIYDDLGEVLANDDTYAEIYSDAVWQVLKEHNLKPVEV